MQILVDGKPIVELKAKGSLLESIKKEINASK